MLEVLVKLLNWFFNSLERMFRVDTGRKPPFAPYVCPNCRGHGTLDSGDVCPRCHGSGRIKN